MQRRVTRSASSVGISAPRQEKLHQDFLSSGHSPVQRLALLELGANRRWILLQQFDHAITPAQRRRGEDVQIRAFRKEQLCNRDLPAIEGGVQRRICFLACIRVSALLDK